MANQTGDIPHIPYFDPNRMEPCPITKRFCGNLDCLSGCRLNRRAACGQPPIYITAAERKVLALLCRGLSNIEIGAALKRSPLTIKNQVKSLIRAFQGRSRLDVAVRALQSGIVRLGDLEVIGDDISQSWTSQP